MTKRALAIVFMLSAAFFGGISGAAAAEQTPQKTEVVCVYYPHWHVYPQGEKWFGKNWTEWEFVKTAKPRFKGHRQPMKPLLWLQ